MRHNGWTAIYFRVADLFLNPILRLPAMIVTPCIVIFCVAGIPELQVTWGGHEAL